MPNKPSNTSNEVAILVTIGLVLNSLGSINTAISAQRHNNLTLIGSLALSIIGTVFLGVAITRSKK